MTDESADGSDAPASRVAPPSSTAAPGVELVESRRDRSLSLGVAPPPSIAATPAASPKRRRLAWALAAFVVGAIVVAAVVAWRKGRYERGAILAYLPEDCASLSVVDYAAFEATPAARATVDQVDRAIEEWAEDADVSAMRTLARAGLRAHGDLREAAWCTPADEEGDAPSDRHMHVVGGVLGGRRFLETLRLAWSRRFHIRLDDLDLDDLDGSPALRLPDGRVVAMPTSSIAIFGKKKDVRALLKPHEIDRSVGLREGELSAFIHDDREAKKDGLVESRTSVRGDRIVHTRVWRPGHADDAMKKATDERRANADALRKFRGFNAIAADLFDPEVSRDGDEAKSKVTFTTDDLTRAVRGYLDATTTERRKLRTAMYAAEDSVVVSNLLRTSNDALGLELQAW